MAAPTSDSALVAASEADRRGPGRPRSAQVDDAIISAVIEMLADGTAAEALSIEAVAARAGVGKATIYRRWANKDALLVDAVASLKGPPPVLVGRSVQEDLIALLRPIGHGRSLPGANVLPCLVSLLNKSPELHQAYQRVVEPRRQLMREVLRRGAESGELRADLDVEVVMSMLAGPMLVKSLVDWYPHLDRADLPERLVAAMWPAMVATAAGIPAPALTLPGPGSG